MSVMEALLVLKEAGVNVCVPSEIKHYSLKSAGERLDCSAKYLREHLAEFPNAWRMTGGEIRIPAKDLEAWAASRRLFGNGRTA